MIRTRETLVNLLLIAAGFGVALIIYTTLFLGGLGPYGMMVGAVTSIVAFWITLELKNAGAGKGRESLWVVFVEQFCLGTGVNLLLHSLLTYAFNIRKTPLLIGLGGIFAAAFLTLRLRWYPKDKRFLLVGFDDLTRQLIDAIRYPIIGVVSESPATAPEGLPWLGEFKQLEDVVRQHRPTNILLEVRGWSKNVPPAALLHCRLSGVEISSTPVLYETLFNRVCCERLRPGDILLSPSLRGDSRTMAIQCVYTNLIGLSLLLLLSPVIVLASLLTFLFSGPGPVLESVEAAGFQHIPFRMLRFRTTRNKAAGELTSVGRWISKLGITNLPQLLNVVRGDMALVGPRPVRAEFARYLTELMPFYSHRFSVRPGMVGWAQLHTGKTEVIPEECCQVEYDLFYVKEGSLWMDIEIMLESIRPAAAQKHRSESDPVSQGVGL